MTAKLESSPRRLSANSTTGILSCPACGSSLKADARWCQACNFTGGDSIAMFPEPPPPLLPIIDSVGILNPGQLRKIKKARDKVVKRFPQFQWRICLVGLSPEISLPLFGFWLLNACPLHELETAEQRVWTVLLLINTNTGNAVVTSGYAAEPCMSDGEWKSVLSDMSRHWSAGKPATAICHFFKSSQRQLEQNWNRFGNHLSSRKES